MIVISKNQSKKNELMNIVTDLLFKKIFPDFNISDFSIDDSSNEIILYLELTPVCPHCKSHSCP